MYLLPGKIQNNLNYIEVAFITGNLTENLI